MSIFCLSTLDIDRVFFVDHLPQPDEKVFASRFVESAGGQGLFVARALAALGDDVTFVGVVGDDPAGAAAIAEVAAIPGLKCKVGRAAGQQTGTCFIQVRPDGEKTVAIAPVSDAMLDGLGLDLELAAGDVVTANLYRPDVQTILFRRARAKGALAVLDLEKTAMSIFGWIAGMALAGEADVVCTNGVTLDAWCEREGIEGGLLDRAERLARQLAGPRRSACVTLGADGVLSVSDGIATHIPAQPVKPINTTGAGDTFLAGLVHGLTAGMDFTAASRFGTLAAADFLAHGAIDKARLSGIQP